MRYLEAMKALVAGGDLGPDAARALMAELMEGALDDIQVGALLTALACRSLDAATLAAFAQGMRDKALPIHHNGPLIDTCGTGGSGLDTANTSTMSAFVLAAAGLKVAKHGNRASSGKCGSMDVLEALGARIDLDPAQASAVLDAQGITFLFAPKHHPAVRHVMPARRALGFRTLFNFLGPLSNPASASHQVLGVSDPAMAPIMAEALSYLGVERALICWGEDGLDEISLCAPTRLWLLDGGTVRASRFEPSDANLASAPFHEIMGGDVERNVTLFRQILAGQTAGARRDHLALNAGAGLWVAGLVDDLSGGYQRASRLLEGGLPFERFEAWRRATVEVDEWPN